METRIGNKNYELELAPINIGGKKIEIYSVKRWDAIESNPYPTEEEYIRNFPLWIKVWEASFVLSDHLTKMNIKGGREILELGAGMGVTGLLLGAMGTMSRLRIIMMMRWTCSKKTRLQIEPAFSRGAIQNTFQYLRQPLNLSILST